MTQAQLAQILGLSKATISYALRGHPTVSAKTQELVKRRARELGYTPNPVASAFLQQIRSGGSKRYRANLAFLLPHNANYPSRYLSQILEGAKDRAAELGYGLDIVHCTKEDNSAKLTRVLVARGIMGVAIGPLPHRRRHITLDWSRFAVATLGYSLIRPSFHRIVHHHSHGMYTAFRMSRRKGFRRIGLILTEASDQRSSNTWSSTYLGIQQTLPEAERLPVCLARRTDFSMEQVSQWLEKEKPDLVISHFKELFPGFSAFLAAQPWNIARVVLDREPDDIYAGIDQRFILCGGMLVDSLSFQIFHNERGIPAVPILSMVEGVWVDHPSLKPAKPPKDG